MKWLFWVEKKRTNDQNWGPLHIVIGTIQHKQVKNNQHTHNVKKCPLFAMILCCIQFCFVFKLKTLILLRLVHMIFHPFICGQGMSSLFHRAHAVFLKISWDKGTELCLNYEQLRWHHQVSFISPQSSEGGGLWTTEFWKV